MTGVDSGGGSGYSASGAGVASGVLTSASTCGGIALSLLTDPSSGESALSVLHPAVQSRSASEILIMAEIGGRSSA
jgi:hypothetical protein